MYAQADEGTIASGFWARNGFVASDEAAWLMTALEAWRPDEHMRYEGVTSVMRQIDCSDSSGRVDRSCG